MNVETWPVAQCPKCLHAESVALNDTTRLCLQPDCRYEWDPTATSGPLAATAIPVPDSHKVATVHRFPVSGQEVAEALRRTEPRVDPDPEASFDLELQLQRARDAFVGREVVWHNAGEHGVVEAVDDAGLARVAFGSGYFVDLTPDEFSLVEVADVADDTVRMIGSIDLSVAAQVVRAGAAALVEDNGERRIAFPPEGWMPEDAEAIPVIEHGAAYAVAVIANAFGMPTEQLVSIATMLDDAATAAREATP